MRYFVNKIKYSIFADKCFQNEKYSTKALTFDEVQDYNITRGELN